MKKLATALVLPIVIAACGGGDKEPPKAPEVTPPAATAEAPKPAETAPVATAEAPKPAETAKPADTTPPPAPLAMPKEDVKISITTKKANLVVKSDGTVQNGGKTSAKLTGTEMQDKDGKSVAMIAGDKVTSPSGDAVATFQGDDLVGANGDKLSMGADGTLTWTSGGKDTKVGKVEKAGDAKRAAMLAAWTVLAPAPKAADAKTATKPADTKSGTPTTAKPADKAAPKK